MTEDMTEDMAEDMTRPQTRHYILLWPHHTIIISKISVGVCMSKYAHTHPQRYLRKHDRVGGARTQTRAQTRAQARQSNRQDTKRQDDIKTRSIGQHS